MWILKKTIKRDREYPEGTMPPYWDIGIMECSVFEGDIVDKGTTEYGSKKYLIKSKLTGETSWHYTCDVFKYKETATAYDLLAEEQHRNRKIY
jgi:hypothetical protein